jgi:putative ABC transport system ATP-binding protein
VADLGSSSGAGLRQVVSSLDVHATGVPPVLPAAGSGAELVKDSAVPTGRAGAELVATGVRKGFGPAGSRVDAVRGVSLTLSGGSATALMGPSGSGKSTLLHLLGAIEAPDGGTVEVDGQDITALNGRELSAYRRSIGMVFQRFHLLPSLTVLENVLAPVIPAGARPYREQAAHLVARVGLGGREKALPAQLSGGQQQRVAIARALIAKPRLLLADEPTGNLDSATGEGILDLLDSLRRESGMTMIVATHDDDVAARCDRVIRMRDGSIVASGLA